MGGRQKGKHEQGVGALQPQVPHRRLRSCDACRAGGDPGGPWGAVLVLPAMRQQPPVPSPGVSCAVAAQTHTRTQGQCWTRHYFWGQALWRPKPRHPEQGPLAQSSPSIPPGALLHPPHPQLLPPGLNPAVPPLLRAARALPAPPLRCSRAVPGQTPASERFRGTAVTNYSIGSGETGKARDQRRNDCIINSVSNS